MGFFSSIGNILGSVGKVAGAVTGNPLFAIGSSVLDGVMSRQAADKASDINRENRATAYQATVKDMRAAGLNPILAYSQGATSIPSAQAASPTNYTQGAASAMQSRAIAAGIDNTVAQTGLNKANESVAVAQAAKTFSEAEIAAVEAHNAKMLGFNPKGLSTLGTGIQSARSLAERGYDAASSVSDRLNGRPRPDDLEKSLMDELLERIKPKKGN